MAFERADGTPFAFIPGQFVQIHFSYADGKPTKRSYSVATIGLGDGAPVQRIEMAVSYVEGGAATELLGISSKARRRRQRAVRPLLPHGRGHEQALPARRDRHRRHAVPRDAAAIEKADREPRHPDRARLRRAQRGELLYGDEFEAFARENPQFHFYACSRATRACRARTTAADTCRSPSTKSSRIRERHRLPVRQSEHGRPGVRAAQGSRAADSAYSARKIRFLAIADKSYCARQLARRPRSAQGMGARRERPTGGNSCNFARYASSGVLRTLHGGASL